MQRVVVLAIALLLAGCTADRVIGPAVEEETGSGLDGRTVLIEEGQAANGQGTCGPGGVLHNAAGRQVGSVPHRQCTAADIAGLWMGVIPADLGAISGSDLWLQLEQTGRTFSGIGVYARSHRVLWRVSGTVERNRVDLTFMWPDEDEAVFRLEGTVRHERFTGTFCMWQPSSADWTCAPLHLTWHATLPGLSGVYYDPFSWQRWHRIAYRFDPGSETLTESYVANRMVVFSEARMGKTMQSLTVVYPVTEWPNVPPAEQPVASTPFTLSYGPLPAEHRLTDEDGSQLVAWQIWIDERMWGFVHGPGRLIEVDPQGSASTVGYESYKP